MFLIADKMAGQNGLTYFEGTELYPGGKLYSGGKFFFQKHLIKIKVKSVYILDKSTLFVSILQTKFSQKNRSLQ